MRKNVVAAGALALIIGIVLMGLGAPLVSNYVSAGVTSTGAGVYSSHPFDLVSSDVVTVDSPAMIYMVHSSSVHYVSRSSIGTYKVAPVAENSANGLTVATWSGLSGNYSIVSFNSSSVNTRVSIATSSSFGASFGYSIGVAMGVVLFLVGIALLFAGLALRKKVPPKDDWSMPGNQQSEQDENSAGSPADNEGNPEHKNV